MRFASIGGSNAGNYAAAGKAVADSGAAMFKKQRDTGPDYTGLSRVAMTAASAATIAATKAAADVYEAGIKAVNTAKQGAILGELTVKKGEYKNKPRMAGILPAIGKIVGSSFKKDPKRPPPLLQAEPVKPEKVERGGGNLEPLEVPTRRENIAIPTSASAADSSPARSSSNGIPRTAPTDGESFTQPQLKQLLLDQGMSDADAHIGSAIGMAESSGNPNARSHPDLEARTGEMSIGLWQHNKNTGEDRHAFYGIKDWNELKTPETNARATMKLFQRRGGWGDWGAYTDGSYKKYL